MPVSHAGALAFAVPIVAVAVLVGRAELLGHLLAHLLAAFLQRFDGALLGASGEGVATFGECCHCVAHRGVGVGEVAGHVTS